MKIDLAVERYIPKSGQRSLLLLFSLAWMAVAFLLFIPFLMIKESPRYAFLRKGKVDFEKVVDQKVSEEIGRKPSLMIFFCGTYHDFFLHGCVGARLRLHSGTFSKTAFREVWQTAWPGSCH